MSRSDPFACHPESEDPSTGTTAIPRLRGLRPFARNDNDSPLTLGIDRDYGTNDARGTEILPIAP